ncbi:solute carrier family 35 member C2 [Lampetra fluviatilis]
MTKGKRAGRKRVSIRLKFAESCVGSGQALSTASCMPARRLSGADWCRLCRRTLLTLGLVVLYYSFSIGITFYNKWMMKGFHFPLAMTMVHMAMNFMFSALVRAMMQCAGERERVALPWPEYLKRVGPTAIASALDIGLSNWSFLFITISLYTMTKSTSIIFILLFSIVFRLERARPSLIVVVSLIAGGLFMFTYESTQFNLEGFLLVLTASFIGGIRWTLTQILTQKAELGLHNPVDALYHLQPLMLAALFPLFLYNEGVSLACTEKLFGFHDSEVLLWSVGTLALGGVLAFGLSFSEFLLVSQTSGLTLSISGIFKEVCTLVLATHINGDIMSPLNWVGFGVCLAGISLHVALKALRPPEVEPAVREREEAVELLLRNGLANDSDSDAESLFDIRDR